MVSRPFSRAELSEVVFSTVSPRVILSRAAQYLGQVHYADRCIIIPESLVDENTGEPLRSVEWSARTPEDDGSQIARFCCSLTAFPWPSDSSQIQILSPSELEPVRSLGMNEATLVRLVRGSESYGAIVFLSRSSLGADDHDLLTGSEVLTLAIERALSLQTLRESESHYRSLSENARVGIIRSDCDGRVCYINSSYEGLTGLSFRALRGNTLEDSLRASIYGEDAPRVIRAYRQLLLEGSGSLRLQYRLQKNRLAVFDQVSIHEGEITSYVFEAGPSIESSEQSRYRRLLEHSEAIIFHADHRHVIHFISRRALEFFGVTPEDFQNDGVAPWFDLVHRDDVERVRATALEMERSRSSFDEEFRVLNRLNGRIRWLYVRVVPVLAPHGEIQGWDGFGIDTTARREAQEALEGQSRKVRALYAVSAAIGGSLDPSHLALRGLTALVEATGADGGVCYLTSGDGEFSVRAKSGALSEHSLGEEPLLELVHQGRKLSHPLLVQDASRELNGTVVSSLGYSSAVLAPVLADEVNVGSVALVSRHARHFDSSVSTLVSAAANQIGLASRQAELFRRSQQQSKNLSALYRISHELSLNLSLDELFHEAFSILRDELGLERIWLGLLSEAGTRIIGQAAYGPGWRRRLVNLNVEINNPTHPLLQVVKKKAAVFLENPEEELQDLALKRVFSLMGVNSVALVPLIALGQVYGVLAVQPSSQGGKFASEELTLLSSLANELAFVLMTKRLEDQIADSEKMRAAGLLAGGIAHNFNNLLQAVMGQASLLELQKNDPAKVEKAAKLISEVVMKGAQLVQKLLSFAQLEEPFREPCDLGELVRRHHSQLERLLAPNQRFVVRELANLPRFFADPQQVVRILSTLISNASEAMPEGGPVEVEATTLTLESNPFELEPGGYLCVSIRDRGRGMDAETKRRCFEPFFSTKDLDRRSGLSLSGAGLSLAAAYTLAQRNGGILSVESGERLGSVFSLLLPVAEEASQSEEKPLDRSKVLALPSRREPPARGDNTSVSASAGRSIPGEASSGGGRGERSRS